MTNYFEIHADKSELTQAQSIMHPHTQNAHIPNLSCNNYVLLIASGLHKKVICSGKILLNLQVYLNHFFRFSPVNSHKLS